MKRILDFIIPVSYSMYLFSTMISMAGTEFFGWLTFILISVAWIYQKTTNKQNIFVKHPFNKFIIFFGLILATSIILSPHLEEIQRPWHYYLGRLRYLLLFFMNTAALVHFIDVKKLLKVLPMVILPILLLYIFQSLSGYRVFGGGPESKVFNWTWNFGKGISGHFVHYIEFAVIFELLTFLLIPFLFIKEYNKKQKILLGTTILISLFSLTVSGTRAFFIAFPITILTMMFFGSNKKFFYVLLILVLISPFVSYKLSPHIRKKAEFTITNIDKFGDPYRFNLWRAHLLMFQDHPIKGAGFYMPIENKLIEPYYKKLKTKKSETYRGTTLAHNSYIDMLSGSGILGFIAFAIMSIMLFYYSIQNKKLSTKTNSEFYEALSLGLIGSITSLYINMLVDSVFLYLKVSYLFIFIAALCICLNKKLRNI